MNAFISENELLEEAQLGLQSLQTPACVFQPGWRRERWSGCRLPPCAQYWYNIKRKKKREHLWKPLLENCSFHSGPFWVKLHWTQHGFGFSVCCVIGPWPAFWASDPCPISTEPNETISPVHFVLSVLDQSPVPRLLRMKKLKKYCLSLRFKCFYIDVYIPNAKLS